MAASVMSNFLWGLFEPGTSAQSQWLGEAHNANKWNFDPEEEWDECGGEWSEEEQTQAIKPHWTPGCRFSRRDSVLKLALDL